MIAVTGATGDLGGRIAAGLAERGAPQRLLVRDPGRAPDLPGAEVHRIGGLRDAPALLAALKGAETLVLVPAADTADRVAQHRTAVNAAAAAGVRRVVYLSFLGAAPDATFLLAREHWMTEEHIRSTGQSWTFLRMSLFLDFVPSLVDDDDRIAGPAGEGRLAPVLRADVAEAAVAVALSGEHDGRIHDLTGPEAVTLADLADALARATGRPITFADQTEEEALAARADLGDEREVRNWVSSYLAIRDGSLDVVSDAVRELTGHDPVGVHAWLAGAARV
jgi:NAD(P)H dehydrogenase (quinone)